MNPVVDHWDLSGRDVVPDLAARAQAGDVGGAVLYALLANDGKDFGTPYENVRSALRIRKKQVLPELEEQANERIRTYKVLFRGLGLLYDDSGILHSTKFGKALYDLLTDQYKYADDYARTLFNAQRRRVAQLSVKPLSRYQLDNPLTQTEYPPETDIHPLRAIWSAMRQLDDRLHWEELGRVLTTCLREEELPGAVERIRTARLVPGYDPRNADQMDQVLGPRTPDLGSNQSDRLDTWYSRAAFKNIFLEPRDREDGYRYLNSDFLDVIDRALASPPESIATDSIAEYMEWVGEVDQISSGAGDSRQQIIDTVANRCRRFGERQIVALVGPAGTGKTTCAWEAANVLVEGDATRISTIQFHAGFTYEEFVAGLAPDGEGSFEPALGALLEINKRAQQEPENLYVLVIDELSRADVANVLGELLTYIEYRDRKFSVPVLGEQVSIARNLIVIATMNPADRSVVNMDDALVRRLRQVEVRRSTRALRGILASAGAEPELIESVAAWFDALPEDAPFGHGLFEGVRNAEDLHNLWWESLQFFLRRGGLVVYPDAEVIERGYVWKERQTPAAHVAALSGEVHNL
jgi:5-methylcytosine-specific restriction protein B